MIFWGWIELEIEFDGSDKRQCDGLKRECGACLKYSEYTHYRLNCSLWFHIGFVFLMNPWCEPIGYANSLYSDSVNTKILAIYSMSLSLAVMPLSSMFVALKVESVVFDDWKLCNSLFSSSDRCHHSLMSPHAITRQACKQIHMGRAFLQNISLSAEDSTTLKWTDFDNVEPAVLP